MHQVHKAINRKKIQTRTCSKLYFLSYEEIGDTNCTENLCLSTIRFQLKEQVFFIAFQKPIYIGPKRIEDSPGQWIPRDKRQVLLCTSETAEDIHSRLSCLTLSPSVSAGPRVNSSSPYLHTTILF